MRIGPVHMTWLHRNRDSGRRELPWDVLTREQLSPEARIAITRAARAAAKDYLDEQREKFEERARAARDRRLVEHDGSNPAR